MMRDPNALATYLEEREGWSFGYGGEPGSHDCARFAGGGVEAVTGLNPLERFSSEWTTRRGARRVLTAHGGMSKAVGEVMTPISPLSAQRGDIGLTPDGALVLFEGDTVVGVSASTGLFRAPRAAAVEAWTS